MLSFFFLFYENSLYRKKSPKDFSRFVIENFHCIHFVYEHKFVGEPCVLICLSAGQTGRRIRLGLMAACSVLFEIRKVHSHVTLGGGGGKRPLNIYHSARDQIVYWRTESRQLDRFRAPLREDIHLRATAWKVHGNGKPTVIYRGTVGLFLFSFQN